jgi:hypothetical protein
VLSVLIDNFNKLVYQFIRFTLTVLIEKMVALIALGHFVEVAYAAPALVCLVDLMTRTPSIQPILGCVLFYPRILIIPLLLEITKNTLVSSVRGTHGAAWYPSLLSVRTVRVITQHIFS